MVAMIAMIAMNALMVGKGGKAVSGDEDEFMCGQHSRGIENRTAFLFLDDP